MNKHAEEKLLKIVKDNYEEIAEEFNQSRKRPFWPEVIRLVEEVKDGESVLDVGCGNGRLLAALASNNIEYFGVDNSLNLIETARANFQPQSLKLKVKSLKFEIGDVLELDKVVREQFDHVFCIAVLHHLPGRELKLKALEQLKLRMKPGGRIVLTVWNLWNKPKFVKMIIKQIWQKFMGKNKYAWNDLVFTGFVKNGGSQRYYHAFTERELKGLIRKAGLKIEELHRDKLNYYLILKGA